MKTFLTVTEGTTFMKVRLNPNGIRHAQKTRRLYFDLDPTYSIFISASLPLHVLLLLLFNRMSRVRKKGVRVMMMCE
jgi:hypothetical protein